jgi:hypothetical protein
MKNTIASIVRNTLVVDALLVLANGAFFLILVTGCNSPPPPEPPLQYGKIDHVARVIMHDRDHYTIVYKEKAADTDLKHLFFTRIGRRVVKTDVPKGEPMWMRWDDVKVFPDPKNYPSHFVIKVDIELHLHDANEINGPVQPAN